MGFVMVTTWRENVAAGRIERKMAVTLTKEQASMLLPLLPNLAGLIASQTSSKAATTNGGEYTQSEALYSISDMFSKKKKNSCSTAAQNYLLTIVRTSAKAANIWEDPPLLRNITAAQFSKFFDTAFLMCPKLKSCRQLLTTRLSRTLINRRLYLSRQRKKRLFPAVFNHLPTATSTEEQNADINHSFSQTEEESWKHPQEGSTPVSASDTTHPNDCDNTLVSGNTVIVVKADRTRIGKGIFLKMNSEEPDELFARVLFLSAKKSKMAELDIELPAKSEHGKFNFKQLEKGDIFVWKVSRLLPDDRKSSTSNNTSFEVQCSTSTIGDLDNYSSDDTEVSPLEMKRMKNIERNKKKMDEIFGTKLKEKTSKIKTKQLAIAPVPAKRKKRCGDHDVTENAKRFKEQPEVPSKPVHDFGVGEYRAVKCDKYSERPLIGCITKIYNKSVDIDWMIGSYSGVWKEWKGRSEGKVVRFAETIPNEDVMMKVVFTKGRRIPPKEVLALKELYADMHV